MKKTNVIPFPTQEPENYVPYVPKFLRYSALEALHRDMVLSAGTLETDSQELKDKFNSLLQKDFEELEARAMVDNATIFKEVIKEMIATGRSIMEVSADEDFEGFKTRLHATMDAEAERLRQRRQTAKDNKHRRRAGDEPYEEPGE